MKYAIWEFIFNNATAYQQGHIRVQQPTGDQAYTLETIKRILKTIQEDNRHCDRHRQGEGWISFKFHGAIFHYQIIDLEVPFTAKIREKHPYDHT